MRPRSTVFAALAMGIGFGLTACGQQSAATPPARGGLATVAQQADPAARWADGYCGALGHLVRALATLPTVDPSTPEQASRTSSDLLTSVVDGLGQAIDGLRVLDGPPGPAAEQARQATISDLTSIRQRASDVHDRIDAAHGDAAAEKAALGDARVTLDRIAALDLLKGLQATPALSAAGQRTQSCQDLTQPK